MRLPSGMTSYDNAGSTSSLSSVMRLYGQLLAVLAGVVVMLTVAGAAQARESLVSFSYTLNAQGYAAADPMAGAVRDMPRPVMRTSEVATPNCKAGVGGHDFDLKMPHLGIVHDQLPVAALRDARTLNMPVPAPRVSAACWSDGVVVSAPQPSDDRVAPEWAAMAQFGVPEELPSLAGSVRAGFYSLF